MDNLRLSILILTFSLLPFHLSLGSSSFSPADHYLVNCGSASRTVVDSYNRDFTGDDSSSSVHLKAHHTISVTDPAKDLSPIYTVSRIFTEPSKYVFNIKDRGNHLVRLHFNTFKSSSFDPINDAQFHVLANGYLLLNDFSVTSMRQKTEIKEYILWIDCEELEILFAPSGRSKFAFISAIEVISAPKDLILDTPQAVIPDGVVKISRLSKNGFQTIHRVNVGGPKVTPFNDTLWRNWVPDDEFLLSKDEAEKVHFNGRIDYQKGGASREVVPDNVCNTARVISATEGKVPQFNITWGFPVVGGYNYVLRTHFCDIVSMAPNLLYFNVYVNGLMAYENLDLSSVMNNMLGSPFYADFVVDGGSSSTLSVSIAPSNVSDPKGIDAILNGIEILKISDSMHSFDGKVSAEMILGNLHTRNIGVFMPLIAGLCLMVAASVVLHRRMFGARETVAWSRLPVETSEINLKSGR